MESSNPLLSRNFDLSGTRDETESMNLQGTVNKAGILMICVLATAIWTWNDYFTNGAAAVGGYLGAHYSRRMNPKFMRMLVVGIGLSMAAYFFWKQYA